MGTRNESVLFVVNDIPDQEGLTRYRHAAGLCAEFETTILSGGNVPAAVRESADEVHAYPDSVPSAVAFLLPFWLLFWTVRTSTSVIVVSPHSTYVLATYAGARLTSSDHVVDFWDDLSLPIASYEARRGLENRAKELYHRTLTRAASRCLSRTDLLILSIHPGVTEKYDIESVPTLELTNGYDPDLLDVDSPGEAGERTRYVYLGRANAKRGLDVVIDTVAEAVPSSRIDVVGPTDATVDRVAARFENVTLHGERPYEEAIEIVARADVGLCVLDTTVQNYRYSYPIKLFEYAALGKAIVASDTPAIRSVLTPGESVVLVDPQSEADLRDAVIGLSTDRDARRKIGTNARTGIRTYAWEEILDRYTRAIRRLSTDDPVGR